MAGAEYDHAESGGFRLQFELTEIMQHINQDAAGFDDLGFRQRARPRGGVDVTADHGYGGNLRERFEDFGGSDIASVENAIGSAQSFDGFGPQQAVGVGDYSEGHVFLGHQFLDPEINVLLPDGRMRPSLRGSCRFITKRLSNAHRLRPQV